MVPEKLFDFSKIEKKWKNKWKKSKIFEAKDLDKKKKFYVLEMYPYPSASGLHMGHAFNYVIGDIIARFMRMKGFNVLYPMGYDSFGLPAENAAIKSGDHPREYTERAIKNFIKQQQTLGLSYDWSRMIKSHDENYYRWNQFFFLKMFEKGLVYRKKASVNWCPKCKTVLANEQVHDGKCWRHSDTEIEIKSLNQWFIKTTQYAEELLNKIKELDWPERIKIMQENWIGKSKGVEIDFLINGEKWPVFTTRPDTIYGVSFLVISAQHPRLMEIVKEENKKEVLEFLKKIKSTSEKESANLEKEGAFTGAYGINPLTKEKVPVWTGNFVIADYGCGMVMAVPAHDQRDFEFAKKYNIPIKVVINPPEYELNAEKMSRAFTGNGRLINSGEFSGMMSIDAIEEISNFIEKNNLGRKTINYKLRDWLISRQRYWGTPIPIIYCDSCGIVPVPEKELPVKLPKKVSFGEGNPLLSAKKWINTKCPKCGRKAKRETDTMDTFFDSSWYYLRFCDAKNKNLPFEKNKVNYWMPVDFYIGGAEHACMHLIYARFFTKALRDLGYLEFDEPFKKLMNQGMIHGEDGHVMSKSRGNVIDPLTISSKYGADSLRWFLVSVASPDKDFSWSSFGVESSMKFLVRFYNYVLNVKIGRTSKKIQHKLNKTIKIVEQAITSFKYNLAIISLRSFVEYLENEIAKEDLKKIILLFVPFCPYLAEELWEKIGEKSFASLADWPAFDETKIDNSIDEAERIVEKTIEDVLNIINIIKAKHNREPKCVYLYVIPKEQEIYSEEFLSKRIGKEVKVFAVNNPNKYDPEKKSEKAKPNKPGIYIE